MRSAECPYLMGKALRPLVGPMHIPDLTLRLLEPLGVISKLQELQCSCLNSLGTKRCFPVFFVSQQEHCIFLEGVDWCHILLHKEGTQDPHLSSAKSNANLAYYVQ